MSKFLETLVRSEMKSCAGKNKIATEEKAIRAASYMMEKKPDEAFEHYKCAFCESWHIGHKTSFDWIPASHKSFNLLLIQYRCPECGICFLTNTVVANRILSHFPAILFAAEMYARCPGCKTVQRPTAETGRKYIPIANLPDDSTETAESLWNAYPEVIDVSQEDDLETENLRLRMAVRNQCGDNLCWLTDPEVGKAIPWPEFQASCQKFHAQLTGTVGVLPPGSRMTIAQLEARVLELEEETARLKAESKSWETRFAHACGEPGPDEMF